MKAFSASLLCAAAVALLAAAPAAAQTRYTCRDKDGAAYTLSRPCPEGMVTAAVSAGPVGQRSSTR